MMDIINLSEFSALVQVILIDLVLAGDNAIVVGMVAAGVEPAQRSRVIMWGIIAATVMRIGFALITVQLLQIVGLVLAGGLLLLWVCWKMWREIQAQQLADNDSSAETQTTARTTLRQAIIQIVIADLSMSLDNVLAVAGASRDHTWVLVVGLIFSIAFMGLAASFIARLLKRHHWIAYIGLAVILYVAGSMIWEGFHQVIEATNMSEPSVS